MSRTIGVHVVLFQNELGQVWRVIRSLTRSIAGALEVGSVQRARLIIGDCSPEPVLEADALADIREFVHSTDVDEFQSEYFSENLMTARAHNQLAELHDSELILVINPDTYAHPALVSTLVNAASIKGVGAADARQIPLEHPKCYDPSTGATSWASGFCVAYSREAFGAVAGYDAEYFPLYCDDVDISWRMRIAGYQVIHVPDAVAFHDKRLNQQATVVASPAEEHYGALARMMLATRYDRPDIVDETISHIADFGTPAQQQAVATYHRRRREGSLPAVLDVGEGIADFVNGGYGRARY